MIKRQKFTNNNYNKSLNKFASQLRKKMTKSESCLWKYVLSSGQMKGYTFNRQRPVLNYIADFMCKELMIIIELDGITHHSENAIEKDEKKDEKLREIGFSVLRFSDDDVLNHLNMVVETIDSCIEQKLKERLKSTKKKRKKSSPYSMIIQCLRGFPPPEGDITAFHSKKFGECIVPLWRG